MADIISHIIQLSIKSKIWSVDDLTSSRKFPYIDCCVAAWQLDKKMENWHVRNLDLVHLHDRWVLDFTIIRSSNTAVLILCEARVATGA